MPFDPRLEPIERYRILVIGRANAGKTTLLKRVCNSTEDPCIYDENGKNLLKETVARGNHDINHPFAFRNCPQFIFHDSLGFEAGDQHQIQIVLSFIRKCAQAKNTNDQLHAIWFCFTPDVSLFLHDLEFNFFNEINVPVIAVFTKFDDFVNQVFNIDFDDEENHEMAKAKLAELQTPLFRCKFPPRAGVYLEDLHFDDGSHQEQVKDLFRMTSGVIESVDRVPIRYRRLQDYLHVSKARAATLRSYTSGAAKTDTRRLAELRKLDERIKGIREHIGAMKIPLSLKLEIFREDLSDRVSDIIYGIRAR